MKWSRKVWVALALGTTVTLLAMRIGLAFVAPSGWCGPRVRRVPGLPRTGTFASYLWSHPKCFAGNVKGVGNVSPPHVDEFQRILHQARAEETFAGLAHLEPRHRLYRALWIFGRFGRPGCPTTCRSPLRINPRWP